MEKNAKQTEGKKKKEKQRGKRKQRGKNKAKRGEPFFSVLLFYAQRFFFAGSALSAIVRCEVWPHPRHPYQEQCFMGWSTLVGMCKRVCLFQTQLGL